MTIRRPEKPSDGLKVAGAIRNYQRTVFSPLSSLQPAERQVWLKPRRHGNEVEDTP